jgi:tetratricopeptide (TPR) repeat protein
MQSAQKRSEFSRVLWILTSIAILIWCLYVCHNHQWRWALLTGLAAAAFVSGSFVGFVFTTYGDEKDSIGKVRDWLVGALAGLTIVKFSSLRGVLLLFAHTTTAADYALTVSVALVFAGLGFYFMFFGRELFFNIPLARKRAERFLIENSHEAGVVTIAINSILPSSVLIGIADADSLLKSDPDKAAALEKALDAPEVIEFLAACEKAITEGRALDWDILSKAANLQYYRAYLPDSADRPNQQEVALEWVSRALVLNPDHVDLTVKRADVLALLSRWRETVATLEALYPRPDCPFFVEQWLGYYLLYISGREDEAIKCCQSYLSRFPDSNESLRNLASAYAQKACLAAKKNSQSLDTTSVDYKNALDQLKEVIRTNPGYLPTIQEKWIAADGSFSCFAQDPAFQKIIHPEEKSTVTPDETKQTAPPKTGS